ncbi:MAG: oligopeptidase A [Gammaproteobacteria bacterium]|nr:oligopeptidase A [Gammaproteobacteria bacterium]
MSRKKEDTIKHNPLLDLSSLPRFDEITPEQVEPAVDHVLAENRAETEHLIAKDSAPTWESFVQPLEDQEERLNRVWSPIGHLNAVRDSDDLRKAHDACLPKLSAYHTEMGQDPRLFERYKTIAGNKTYERLDVAQKKIIENDLRDFRLSGVELDSDAKQRFKQIEQELSTLSNRFGQHLLDATHAWQLVITDPADLSGLPDSALAVAKQTAEQEELEGWKFTLDAPSYIAFLTYSEHAELRRTMYQAYVTRASELGPHAGQWDNTQLIRDILRLRLEQARLLGFANYAEYSLQIKMAESVEQVISFLTDLAARSHPIAKDELDEVQRFASDEYGVSTVAAWDLPYYSEKLRQTRYAFTQEEVRAYFPLHRVLSGMFAVVNRLYGVDVQQRGNVPTWHPDVAFYEISTSNGEIIGQFYVDLYARPHKRGGAWMDDCVSRKRTDQGVQVPVAYLTCNFSPPVADKSSLLTHDEVLTLFHEFGHGLHHLLTQINYVGVAGINGVAWDAVEVPSQFMENWCWEKEALDLISSHHLTGEPLPQVLLKKMKAAKNFQAAMQMVRQLEFSMFDMRLHSEFDPNGEGTVQQLLDSVREEVAVFIPPEFNRFQNSFSHIFAGGYAAGYYSYKWAEVLSADAFSRFEEEGIFNLQTGRDFKHHILEQGGAREPMELFVAFRGREPEIDALLRHSGLL